MKADVALAVLPYVAERGVRVQDDGRLPGDGVNDAALIMDSLMDDGHAHADAPALVAYGHADLGVDVGAALRQTYAWFVFPTAAMQVVGVRWVGDGREGIELRGQKERVGMIEPVVVVGHRDVCPVAYRQCQVVAEFLVIAERCQASRPAVPDGAGVETFSRVGCLILSTLLRFLVIVDYTGIV